MLWRSIALSEDRRTITVSTTYPLAGFCAKDPGGVTVDVDASVARVSAWVVEQRGRGTVCSSDCGVVRQRVSLERPLPAQVRLEPPDGAVRGCYGDGMTTSASAGRWLPAFWDVRGAYRIQLLDLYERVPPGD